jgi:MoaA/NifB/PqqE/SkfB family radical SAM enzyme/Flp pilus assembly protein TadD
MAPRSSADPQILQALAAANRAYAAGRLGEAEALYRRILSVDQNNAEALHWLGTLALRAGRPDAALELLQRATRVAPRRAQAWSDLGTALIQLERLAEARDALRRAVKADPRFTAATLNLVTVLLMGERFAEAEKALRSALKARSDVPALHERLGHVLAQQRRLDEAEQAYRRAIATAETFAEGRIELAGLMVEQERFAEALDLLAPLAAAPSAKAHYLRGVCLRALGQDKEGLAAVAQARGLMLAPYEKRGMMPQEVYLQFSRRCNLRCTMCGHAAWKENTGFMDRAVFEQAMAAAKAAGIGALTVLSGQGEPLLHPQVFDFLEQAVAEGFAVNMVTNGTPLTPERIDRLAQIGLTQLQFSFAGYDRDSYEQTYVGAKFDKVVENLRGLVAALRRHGSRTMLVVKAVCPDPTYEYVERTRAFVRSLGVERVLTVMPNNFGGVVETGEYHAAADMHSFKRLERHCLLMCRNLLRSVGVYHDGSVTACACYDTNGELGIGRVSDGIAGLRTGPAFTAILDAFRQGDVSGLPMCSRCDDAIG